MSKYSFNSSPKPAAKATAEKNRKFAQYLTALPANTGGTEYELACSRCIYPADNMLITDEDGNEVWNLEKYSFLKESKDPDTVNPDLWENGRCNLLAGVFEVVPRAIYQVRGFDLANFTIIRSKTGWIVQDCTTTVETARGALRLLEMALGEQVAEKIRAVIISHSHIDHYGGIKGVVQEEMTGPACEGKIPIYAPAGFELETVREHSFAGPAMSRRSPYQTGRYLEAGPCGRVSTGIGLGSAKGTYSYITPTDFIAKDCSLVIDGITVEFQLTPGTEAPAEMNNYFADYRALWMAENCNGTLHNLSPIRGAQLRDASAWASYILEAEEKFALRSDVVFQSHNWPRFNTKENPDAVSDFLIKTAAVYKYIHDKTLSLANKGLTAREIAAQIDIPDGLASNSFIRPYYGTPQINARAVFAKYLGVYSGIITDLDPLTEKEEAKLFVEYAGGTDAVIERASADFENGEYKRAANAAYRAVLCEPENLSARYLAADALEQLGYAARSGIWRNAYLTAAMDLRSPGYTGEYLWGDCQKTRSRQPRALQNANVTLSDDPLRRGQIDGLPEKMPDVPVMMMSSFKAAPDKGTDLLERMSADLLLAQLGIRLDYDALRDVDFTFALTITDENRGNCDMPAKHKEQACQQSDSCDENRSNYNMSVKYKVHVCRGIFLPVRSACSDIEYYAEMPRAALIAWAGGNLASAVHLIKTNIYEKLKMLE